MGNRACGGSVNGDVCGALEYSSTVNTVLMLGTTVLMSMSTALWLYS